MSVRRWDERRASFPTGSERCAPERLLRGLLVRCGGALTLQLRLFVRGRSGYLLLDGALSAGELLAAQAAAEEFSAASQPKPELWCWNKDVEALVFHRSFWPTVMELTNGKPKMKGAQFINDDPVHGTGATNGKGGGHLHCARTDFGPESATFYQERGELRCNDMIVFIYLTEVQDGDGGLGVRASVIHWQTIQS